MKIFGYKKRKCPNVIDVVGLIPKGKETIKETIIEEDIEEEYQVGSFALRTHTLYFDKDALFSGEKFEFSGSFKELLK